MCKLQIIKQIHKQVVLQKSLLFKYFHNNFCFLIIYNKICIINLKKERYAT